MKNLLAALLLVLPVAGFGETTTFFKGLPSMKISEGGVERTPEQLKPSKAASFGCEIIQIDSNYYWASRENTSLIRMDAGAYITFVAANGSGYIRIVKPDLKEAAAITGETEKKFDYVEHLLIGLKSITYYGKTQ